MHAEKIIVTYFHRMPSRYRDEMRAVLEACDEEFVPPLSQRSLPWQTKPENSPESSEPAGIGAYLRSLEDESFLVMTDADDRVVAFLSYMPSHVHPEETEGRETSYVTTICVLPTYRRHGLARRMYEILVSFVPSNTITVRTWSTNEAHTRLLESLGYRERTRIADDRGPGIDTVYYEMDAYLEDD